VGVVPKNKGVSLATVRPRDMIGMFFHRVDGYGQKICPFGQKICPIWTNVLTVSAYGVVVSDKIIV
jgi:hypothetical protein